MTVLPFTQILTRSISPTMLAKCTCGDTGFPGNLAHAAGGSRAGILQAVLCLVCSSTSEELRVSNAHITGIHKLDSPHSYLPYVCLSDVLASSVFACHMHS